MSTHRRRDTLDRLHAHTKATRTARRHAHTAGPLGLDPEEATAHYPVGHFGPQYGLTPAQAWEASRLLARANRLRPIRGRHAERRHRLRMGGIISAVLGGRVGSSAFGRSLHGHRGGNVMRDHALVHLRAIAPLGARAAQAAREGKQMLKDWEQRQSAPETYVAWQRSLTAGPAATGTHQSFMS